MILLTCEKNILIPNRDILNRPVQTIKSITKRDLDKKLKPIEKIINATKTSVLKIFAFTIFIISHTLVYLHIPLYKANILKQNIFRVINIKIFWNVSILSISTGILKSKRNNMLRYNEQTIIILSARSSNSKFLLRRFFI